MAYISTSYPTKNELKDTSRDAIIPQRQPTTPRSFDITDLLESFENPENQRYEESTYQLSLHHYEKNCFASTDSKYFQRRMDRRIPSCDRAPRRLRAPPPRASATGRPRPLGWRPFIHSHTVPAAPRGVCNGILRGAESLLIVKYLDYFSGEITYIFTPHASRKVIIDFCCSCLLLLL
jgi:hypothetical protein